MYHYLFTDFVQKKTNRKLYFTTLHTERFIYARHEILSQSFYKKKFKTTATIKSH